MLASPQMIDFKMAIVAFYAVRFSTNHMIVRAKGQSPLLVLRSKTNFFFYIGTGPVYKGSDTSQISVQDSKSHGFLAKIPVSKPRFQIPSYSL